MFLAKLNLMLRESVMLNLNNDQLVSNVMIQTQFRQGTFFMTDFVETKAIMPKLSVKYAINIPNPRITLVSQSFWTLWLTKIYCKESQKKIVC